MQLSQKWIDHLAKLPETGMGYQIVTVHLKNSEKRKKIVIASGQNICATLEDDIDFSDDDITDITMP